MVLAGSDREDAEPVGEAIDAALHYLSYRPRARQEVRRKLEDRGFSAPVIEAVLERLEALDLIDDAGFVELWVRDRVARRPTGIRRLLSELYYKGISRELASPIIQRVLREEGTSERELAKRAARVRYRALSDPDDRVVRRKLYGHLSRRGFPSGIARDVVRALLDSERQGFAR